MNVLPVIVGIALVVGTVNEQTKAGFRAIVDRLHQERSVDAVILGCTELPMVLAKDELPLPSLDTAAIHIDAIVSECLAED